MLERLQWKGNTYPLVVGMKTCKTTFELSMMVSQNIENQSNSGHNNTTLGHIKKRCSIILKKHLFNYVHSGIFSIARTWKQPRCLSTAEWIKKIWHIYTLEYLLSSKNKEWHLEFDMQMVGTRKNHPVGVNPDPENDHGMYSQHTSWKAKEKGCIA